MAIALLFLFGIGNFAMHKAVIESGHPLLAQVPWGLRMLQSRLGLVLEFVMLAGAMLMVAEGALAWAWGYAAYTVMNAISAWLILSDRA